jgi:hypothetical protein
MVSRLGHQATREPCGCGRWDNAVARELRRAAGAAGFRRKKPAVTILFAYDGSESADAAITAAGMHVHPLGPTVSADSLAILASAAEIGVATP